MNTQEKTQETPKVSQEQIKAWKEQFQDVFKVKVEDKEAYFRPPTRKAYSYASQVGTKDPMKFNEMILKDCFLGGDDDLINNERYLLTMGQHVVVFLNIMESSLEKL